MAKLRLPKHLQLLNPELGDEVNLPARPRPVGVDADKRHEFGYWWRLLSGGAVDPGGFGLVEGQRFQVPGRPRAYEFDWAFPRFLVAVEVDGGQHEAGGGRHATDGDRWKLNEAAAAGWRVFRFSPDMLTDDPARCVLLVGQLLRALERRN